MGGISKRMVVQGGLVKLSFFFLFFAMSPIGRKKKKKKIKVFGGAKGCCGSATDWIYNSFK
jgi:hypothetical protein